MTYALAAPFQAALYTTLSEDSALDALVHGHIYDSLPSGTLPDLYVVLGPEDVQDVSDISGAGALHDAVISIITNDGGFLTVKQVAAAICDALLPGSFPLSRGRVVSFTFQGASARRDGDGATRRVDLRFRARLSDA